MDLWIRTQSKEGLVKVNEIWINGTNGNLISCQDGQLGLYKSKERALEVLDKIAEFKNSLISITLLKEDDRAEALHKVLEAEGSFIFEMPEE